MGDGFITYRLVRHLRLVLEVHHAIPHLAHIHTHPLLLLLLLSLLLPRLGNHFAQHFLPEHFVPLVLWQELLRVCQEVGYLLLQLRQFCR